MLEVEALQMFVETPVGFTASNIAAISDAVHETTG
jgi:hypothetical protein